MKFKEKSGRVYGDNVQILQAKQYSVLLALTMPESVASLGSVS